MSNEPKAPNEAAPAEAAAASPEKPEPVSPAPQQVDQAAAASAGKHHDDLIAELRREVADLKDRVLRAHAEVENIRKRTEREKEDTAKYAITKFARDVLTVGDNFQRALGAVPAGAADADATLKSLIDGVTLIEREFLSALERHGVKRLEPKGEAFNPHVHQAVMEMPRPDVAAGTVVQVFQSGYTIEDRVLRPAMVVVATGGPKSGAQASPAPSEATSAEPAPGDEAPAPPEAGNATS
jgi:molecular chaperone GrpE